MSRYHNFGAIADIKRSRTKMRVPFGVKTSLNVGDLVPLKVIEVLPGDTWKIKGASVARVSSAFLRPVMDNLFMDVHYFFVPYRLVFNKAEEVFGKATPSMYDTGELETIPTLGSCTITGGTVGDYLGLPPGNYPAGLSVLKFRAFALIYDKWFRNENVVDEMLVQKGAVAGSEAPNNNAWSASNYTGKLPKVSKIKDIFTACLPAPQKGAASDVPVNMPFLPVVTQASTHYTAHTAVSPLKFVKASDPTVPAVGTTTDYFYSLLGAQGVDIVNERDVFPDTVVPAEILPGNLYVKPSGKATITVNDLRFAFAFQKSLEMDARAGSRFNEYLLSRFGVVNPDARLQLPEYLGGGRMPVTIQQVAQTSESSEASALGEVGAFSLSNGYSKMMKGFTEPGYIFVVGAIKQIHSYQQGIEKSWLRTKREDFFDPLFAHIGEQPIYREQLYAPGISKFKDIVFGYNEYGAEYRYIPNEITGQMRSAAAKSLDIWHFADLYGSAPTLSKSFVEETSAFVDRTLPVKSTDLDQFLLDLYFDAEATRVMPLYSTPGLIDH